MQLAPSEKADGKPACFYWRSVPISGAAVSRLQPSLPPLKEGPLPPIPNADYATAIWAMEGYLQAVHLKAYIAPLCTAHSIMLHLPAVQCCCAKTLTADVVKRQCVNLMLNAGVT